MLSRISSRDSRSRLTFHSSHKGNEVSTNPKSQPSLKGQPIKCHIRRKERIWNRKRIVLRTMTETAVKKPVMGRVIGVSRADNLAKQNALENATYKEGKSQLEKNESTNGV
ncbi:hypothetical protein DdX_10623 [Ditylenchus destructor]|uniref:Uncharacterized protein n=1 Tax=Ditylenchus destructor TaxID=166010 RepID=A0AAD4N1L2_9BILA|nr:hypothetical protein DdX_10623 [Ditylenchus destructor]